MAPYLKFLIPLAFGAAGLWAFVALPLVPGILAFAGLFFLGSLLGIYVFKRTATAEQIKQDLEARLHND